MRIAIGICALVVLAWSPLAFSRSYKSLLTLDSAAYNGSSLPFGPLDWGLSGWLSKSTEFPDAELVNAKTGVPVRISALVKDRPIVLEMGSITCPAYDINIKAMRALEEKYKGKIDFYTVYVREHHPNPIYGVHRSMAQKLKYAKELAEQSDIHHPVLVDDLGGSLHQALGSFGNPVYLIGKDMHVNHWSIFVEPTLLDQAITSLLASDGRAQSARFVCGVDVHPLKSSGYTETEKEQTLSRMKERGCSPELHLSEDQLRIIYETIDDSRLELMQGLSPAVRKTLDDFLKERTSGSSEASLNHDQGKVLESFRSEFQARYERWRKLNGIKNDFTCTLPKSP